MATVSITTHSATEVKLTIDGVDHIYKKAYCFCDVGGDYIYFYAHQQELNFERQQYTILWTDITSPTAIDASKMKLAIDKIIHRYGVVDLAYLSYYDTTTQTNASTVNYFKYNTKVKENAINITNGNEIVVERDGFYNIQFSAQVEKTDSGKDKIEIWLEKDGTNVIESSTEVTLTGNNDRSVASWNWMMTLNAGSKLKIAWYSADNHVQILHRADTTTPTRPSVPSVIVTVHQIQGGNE